MAGPGAPTALGARQFTTRSIPPLPVQETDARGQVGIAGSRYLCTAFHGEAIGADASVLAGQLGMSPRILTSFPSAPARGDAQRPLVIYWRTSFGAASVPVVAAGLSLVSPGRESVRCFSWPVSFGEDPRC